MIGASFVLSSLATSEAPAAPTTRSQTKKASTSSTKKDERVKVAAGGKKRGRQDADGSNERPSSSAATNAVTNSGQKKVSSGGNRTVKKPDDKSTPKTNDAVEKVQTKRRVVTKKTTAHSGAVVSPSPAPTPRGGNPRVSDATNKTTKTPKSPAARKPAASARGRSNTPTSPRLRTTLQFGDVVSLRHTADVPAPVYPFESQSSSNTSNGVTRPTAATAAKKGPYGDHEHPYGAYVVIRVITAKEAESNKQTQVGTRASARASTATTNKSSKAANYVCLQDSHGGRVTVAMGSELLQLYDPSCNSHVAIFADLEKKFPTVMNANQTNKQTYTFSSARLSAKQAEIEIETPRPTRRSGMIQPTAQKKQSTEAENENASSSPLLSESAIARNALGSLLPSRSYSFAFKLKRELKQLAAITEQDGHFSKCELCDQPGNLLMCDTCAFVYHLDCCTPPLTQATIPKIEFRCHYCRGLKPCDLAESFVDQVSALITNLFALDTEAVFHQPVCVQYVVQNYLEKISVPMDLATIQFKHRARCYRKLADVRADVNLMITNCLIFNRGTDPTLVAYANSFSDAVAPLFDGSRCVDFPVLPTVALLKIKGRSRDRITGKLLGAPVIYPTPHAANNRSRINRYLGPIKVHVLSPYADARILYTLTPTPHEGSSAGGSTTEFLMSDLGSGSADLATTSMRLENGAKLYGEPIYIPCSSVLRAMVVRPSTTGGASEEEMLPMPPVHYVISSQSERERIFAPTSATAEELGGPIDDDHATAAHDSDLNCERNTTPKPESPKPEATPVAIINTPVKPELADTTAPTASAAASASAAGIDGNDGEVDTHTATSADALTPFDVTMWRCFLERVTDLGSSLDNGAAPILNKEEIRIYRTVCDAVLEINRTGQPLLDRLVGVVNRSDTLRVVTDFDLFRHTNDIIPSTPGEDEGHM